MISHKNILSCVSGYYFHPDLSWKSEDRYLSYLPLPHLMERSLSFFLFYVGANVM
jgi:long-subunit acyl-CoA synthetase (AMP-forming)